VIKIIQSETFKQWLLGLKDRAIRARVHIRMQRIEAGNIGDVKPVGEGISELRVDYGPGYRVYFTQREQCTVILLCGGDKASQIRDIDRAKSIAKSWKELNND
jgi:putative addiction module killer protein